MAKRRAGRHGELRLVAKIGSVSLVGCKYFLKNVAHNGSLVEELVNCSRYRRWKTDTRDKGDRGSELQRISRQRRVRV